MNQTRKKETHLANQQQQRLDMNLADLQESFKFTEELADRFQSESATSHYEPIAVTKEQKREQYERFLYSLPEVLVSV